MSDIQQPGVRPVGCSLQLNANKINSISTDTVRTSPRWKVVIARCVLDQNPSYTVNHRARPGCSPGRKADHETASHQSIAASCIITIFVGYVNPPESWNGRDDTTCTTWRRNIHNITSRLLQLITGKPPAGYAWATAACRKRSSVVNPQPQPMGSLDTRSASAALVASTLAYPVQVVFHYAVHSCRKMPSLHDGVRSCRKMPSLHDGVRSNCRWQRISSRAAFGQFDFLHHTVAANEIRGTSIFMCRSSCWNSRCQLPAFRNILKNYFYNLAYS